MKLATDPHRHSQTDFSYDGLSIETTILRTSTLQAFKVIFFSAQRDDSFCPANLSQGRRSLIAGVGRTKGLCGSVANIKLK